MACAGHVSPHLGAQVYNNEVIEYPSPYRYDERVLLNGEDLSDLVPPEVAEDEIDAMLGNRYASSHALRPGPHWLMISQIRNAFRQIGIEHHKDRHVPRSNEPKLLVDAHAPRGIARPADRPYLNQLSPAD